MNNFKQSTSPTNPPTSTSPTSPATPTSPPIATPPAVLPANASSPSVVSPLPPPYRTQRASRAIRYIAGVALTWAAAAILYMLTIIAQAVTDQSYLLATTDTIGYVLVMIGLVGLLLVVLMLIALAFSKA